MKFLNKLSYIALALVAFTLSSCQDTKSYSELLTEEEHSVNWYLAQHEVCLEIPEDGNFIVGENAPYYRMDGDGYVYMQVINKGTDQKAKDGDVVYFRFMRMNLNYYIQNGSENWDGNAESAADGSTSFVFGNEVYPSTTQYGTGIQVPMKYLGYDCEVNLIVKSPEGFPDEQAQCIPFLYNIRYFKALY